MKNKAKPLCWCLPLAISGSGRRGGFERGGSRTCELVLCGICGRRHNRRKKGVDRAVGKKASTDPSEKRHRQTRRKLRVPMPGLSTDLSLESGPAFQPTLGCLDHDRPSSEGGPSLRGARVSVRPRANLAIQGAPVQYGVQYGHLCNMECNMTTCAVCGHLAIHGAPVRVALLCVS